MADIYKKKTGKVIESSEKGALAVSVIPTVAATVAASWYLKRKGYGFKTALVKSPRVVKVLSNK